jgi:hypothetical protein
VLPKFPHVDAGRLVEARDLLKKYEFGYGLMPPMLELKRVLADK